ncbi:polyhydroxyalkanoic acid system protein [Longibacter salinarum]|uniref:Polyhydroxyalkanoic acid system protein n=1 Tax=Longibacter salinarum TaxID=1850348 RepID=A0A2A8CWJ7_9BACT|nr:polyhydroxyalkanoic acid system family protein [Longibacter salinarum]PEN13016.1 polyhydroxyalkanoic acid system protein [Longibacter salinarum]
MADIEISRSHSLGTSGARTAVEKVASKLHEKLNVDTEWQGDTLHFEGNGANGNIEVKEQHVYLALNLNFVLKSMKGWIRNEAEKYLDKYLAQASA